MLVILKQLRNGSSCSQYAVKALCQNWWIQTKFNMHFSSHVNTVLQCYITICTVVRRVTVYCAWMTRSPVAMHIEINKFNNRENNIVGHGDKWCRTCARLSWIPYTNMWKPKVRATGKFRNAVSPAVIDYIGHSTALVSNLLFWSRAHAAVNFVWTVSVQ